MICRLPSILLVLRRVVSSEQRKEDGEEKESVEEAEEDDEGDEPEHDDEAVRLREGDGDEGEHRRGAAVQYGRADRQEASCGALLPGKRHSHRLSLLRKWVGLKKKWIPGCVNFTGRLR